ncbi:MAG: histidine kinase [Acidobacteriota bacterium]|nr:histidine kinase [Acidobacteriota bacterium]
MRERVGWCKLGWRMLGRVAAVWMLFGLMQAAWGLEPGRQVGQYRRQSWQVDSGLPQNTVHAVVQTRDGFVWFATEGGLVRFDGLDFRVFDSSNTPELRSNFIDGLMEGRDGALWISTLDGLLRLKGGGFRAFAVADGLPSNSVTATYQQSSGRLVAVTAGGLATLDGERFREIAGTEFLSNAEQVSVLPDDAEGTLWVGAGEQLVPVAAGATSGGHGVGAHVGAIAAIGAGQDGELWVGGAKGLECFRGGRSCSAGERGVQAGKGVLLAGRSVTALLPVTRAGDGGMWVGTTKGLLRMQGGVVTEVGAPRNTGGSAAGPLEIRSLFEDRSGVVWVMSKGGIATVSRARTLLVEGRQDIRDVLCVLEDREGNMWFGTESDGASVLRDQPFSSITMKDGLADDFVRAVFEDHAGVVWVGMDKGGVDRIVDGKVAALGEVGGVRTNVVLALAETAEGMWLGTPEGLIRIKTGTGGGVRGGRRGSVATREAQLFTAEDGLPDNFVRSLYADRDGTLWVGTRNGLSHRSGGVFRTYTTSDGLGSDVIGSVLRGAPGVSGGSGELWVGTLGGLSRLAGEHFVNYTVNDGLGGDAVTALFEDARGSLWIGTNGSGLTRWRDGRFAEVAAEKSGLPQTVYGMLEDADGRLWMSSQTGVYRVSAAALTGYAAKAAGELAVERLGVADGMQISECSSGGHPSAWKMRDGTLWFATRKGVSWVQPGRHSKSDDAPPVAIERVLLDERAAAVLEGAQDGVGGAELVVPAGGKRITIRYAGLSFVAPQKVRYRYRLEGFDHGWVEAGNARTAYYTNVPPGRYRFSVMASDGDGLWSARAASLSIRVQPRFYQTAWFRGLMVLVLLGIGYGLYRVRVHTVEARYKAVMAERGRLAREVHDTLAQGYVGVSVQLEIVSRLLQGSQPAALEQLKQTKELVRSSLAEARSSIWNLRSHGNDAEILPSRMAAAAKSKGQAGGPAIVFEVHGTYRPLPREVEDQILRIAQEAVNNSVRHAGASRVEVSLTFGDKVLLLRVSDDGRGFEEAFDSFAASGHFGLTGMRERAAAIGAQLRVEGGGHGRGAVVSLRMAMRGVDVRHEAKTGELI